MNWFTEEIFVYFPLISTKKHTYKKIKRLTLDFNIYTLSGRIGKVVA